MSAFGGLILTNKGRNLQAKAQLGTSLHFTRIGLGDYDIGGESILDLSSLKHEVKSLPIVKLKLLFGGKAVVGAVFSNEDMRSGFYWREIGVFANDPENGEILYCYGNAGINAEYIPAGGGADIIEKSIDVTAIVGNTTNVTATIDQSLIFASQKDIENKVDKVPGKQLSTEDYTTQEKQKLASLSNYSHPSEHPASMIKMGDGSTVEGKIMSHLADFESYLKKAIFGDNEYGSKIVENIDLINKCGFYVTKAAITIDGITDWFFVMHIETNAGNKYSFQILSAFQQPDKQYYRSQINGSWSAPKRILTKTDYDALNSRITYGTAVPGTLAEGQVYFQYE